MQESEQKVGPISAVDGHKPNLVLLHRLRKPDAGIPDGVSNAVDCLCSLVAVARSVALRLWERERHGRRACSPHHLAEQPALLFNQMLARPGIVVLVGARVEHHPLQHHLELVDGLHHGKHTCALLGSVLRKLDAYTLFESRRRSKTETRRVRAQKIAVQAVVQQRPRGTSRRGVGSDFELQPLLHVALRDVHDVPIHHGIVSQHLSHTLRQRRSTRCCPQLRAVDGANFDPPREGSDTRGVQALLHSVEQRLGRLHRLRSLLGCVRWILCRGVQVGPERRYPTVLPSTVVHDHFREARIQKLLHGSGAPANARRRRRRWTLFLSGPQCLCGLAQANLHRPVGHVHLHKIVRHFAIQALVREMTHAAVAGVERVQAFRGHIAEVYAQLRAFSVRSLQRLVLNLQSQTLQRLTRKHGQRHPWHSSHFDGLLRTDTGSNNTASVSAASAKHRAFRNVGRIFLLPFGRCSGHDRRFQRVFETFFKRKDVKLI